MSEMSQEALLDPAFLVKYEDFEDKTPTRFVDESANDEIELESYEKKLQKIIGEDPSRLEIDLQQPEIDPAKPHISILNSFKASNQ